MQSTAKSHAYVAVFRPRLLLLASILLLGVVLGACGGGDSPSSGEETAVEAQPEPVASTEPSPPAGRTVVSDTLPYAEVDEELVYGHFVFPSDMIEPLPAVIIIHEWWGLDDTVRQAADRLAAQGYIVLALDLFAGRTADEVTAARSLMLEVVEDQASATENVEQALAFVVETAGAPGVAAFGWGLGGSWALNAAILAADDLDAAVLFYGQVSDEPARLEPISAPLLGFFGEDDRGVAAADVRAFEAALDALGKRAEITILPGAGHGFANPASRNYEPELASETWDRALEFLATELPAAGS